VLVLEIAAGIILAYLVLHRTRLALKLGIAAVLAFVLLVGFVLWDDYHTVAKAQREGRLPVSTATH
jgi:hypothetical protein